MALFEDSAVEIGALADQASTLLPPGFGAAIDSASDTGITQGQGLGVGGIPPGILKQIQAANMFGVHNGIANIELEVDELRELTKLNDMEDIDALIEKFEDFDESVNLAKTLLANGIVPDAQVKLALANEIKDDLIYKIQMEAGDKSEELIKEFLDEQKNLGLTKKDIKGLENILEDLATEGSGDGTPEEGVEGDEGSPGKSEDAPGQNKEDAPGNSGDAPGQNKDKDEKELPPGFEAAGDNPADIAKEKGKGLGLGKIPPGLAKLFGYDDGTGDNEDYEAPEGLPPGFGAAGDNPSENGFANGQGLGLGNITLFIVQMIISMMLLET